MTALDPRLRAAFEAELGDCLAGLRAQLGRLRAAGCAQGTAELKELHRLAHTIKGGGRILGEPVCLEVGRRLEELFKALRDQPRPLDSALLGAVEDAFRVLDQARASLGGGGAVPDITAVSGALDRILEVPRPVVESPPAGPVAPVPAPGRPAAGPGPATPREDRSERLRRAFMAEFPEHLAGLRGAAAGLPGADAPVSRGLLESAYRAAHNLKGAAGAVGLPQVVALAHELEDVLHGLLRGERASDSHAAEAIRRAADAIEDACQVIRAPAVEAIGTAGTAGPVPAAAPVGPAPVNLESLRVDSTHLDRLKGQVSVHSTEGTGTRFVLTLPTGSITHRLLVLGCQGARFAVPFEQIEAVLLVRPDRIETVEGRAIVRHAGKPLSLISLAALTGLGDPPLARSGETLPVVILRSAERRWAVVGERETGVQALPGPAGAASRFSGGALLEDGSVALVLAVDQLAEPGGARVGVRFETEAPAEAERARTILVVDDSFTARTLHAGILEASGFEVLLAVDGQDGLRAMRRRVPDLVITDIQMPRMDRLSFLGEIKRDRLLRDVPVVLVSSLEDASIQEQGLHLGAAAYIVKRQFEHQELLRIVGQLL